MLDSDSVLSRLQQLVHTLHHHRADELLINGQRGWTFISGTERKTVPAKPHVMEGFVDFLVDLAELSGGRIDALSPSFGSCHDELQIRWHALLAPVASDGFVFSIRRHRFGTLELHDFEITPDSLKSIHQAIDLKQSMIVSAPTGTGKTSFLACLLKRFHKDDRVVIVETLSEIATLSPTWIRLTEAKPLRSGLGAYSIRDIANDVLRLRPDRVVVGEIRSSEADVFLTLAQTGHGGCYSTIHAGGIDEAIHRFKRLCGSETDRRGKVSTLIVQLRRGPSGSVAVSEVGPIEL